MKKLIIFWTVLISFLAVPEAHSIINGTPDTTHDCVGVVYYEGDAITTGVLINDSWVLTVAHALEYGTASYFIIGDDFNDQGSSLYYTVDQVIVHPDFKLMEGLPVNNFALLHLATPVHNVDILPLMSSTSLQVGINALVIGYGSISTGNDNNTSRYFIMNVINSIEADTFTLAFDPGGPCNSDTGGPCIISSGGTDYIAGIISYGDCSTYTICGKVSSVYTFITDTITPGGGETNNIPTAPGLLSPPDEATGIDTASVTFSWTPSTDADGDTISYQFYLSEDSSLSGCTPVDVAAKSSFSVHIAGFSFSGIFLCLFLAGRRRNMRRIPVICLVLLLCAFAACSNSGNSTSPVNPANLSHIETGLTPSTTYYWKVTADDGQGGICSSEIRSFTTTGGL